MNILQKDFKTLWRSSVIWLVLALLSFVLAWLFWQMLDRYITLQGSFASLANPPTITQAMWTPFVLMLAKLMMLMIAMTAGTSVAQERSQKTLWYLLINNSSPMHVIGAKFKVQLTLLLFVGIELLLVFALLTVGGELNNLKVLISLIGLCLYCCWLMSLGMWISSQCQSPATAVLLSLLVFVLVWMLGGQTVNQEYGLNWLSLFSPAHHLQWFCEGQLAVSSLLYFIGGSVIFLRFSALQIKQLRKLW